jgi:small-conductance mechanosensitive channel
MSRRISFALFAVLILVLVACAEDTADISVTPMVTPTLQATVTGESVDAAVPESPATPVVEEGAAENESGEDSAVAPGNLIEVAETRAPQPTATPGPISEAVSEVTASAGLNTDNFLGLAAEDWINLGLSLLVVIIGYLVGTWTIRRLLPRVVRRTTTPFDDDLLKATGDDVRWLIVLLALNFATGRLLFLRAEFKSVLGDVYFVVATVLVTRMVWRLINLADQTARKWAAHEDREQQLTPIIDLAVRGARLVAVVAVISVLLSHFGLDVTAIAAVAGLLGLGIGLAARDTIADIISGIIIFVDQPFRVGDRIEVRAVNTWGDVAEIGLRSTRIVTRDNRMVIVPNSVAGGTEVINYSYPDPTFRVQTDVGVSYDADVESARQVIIDTVRQVEGVMPEKPVDALYNEMGDSAMIFRVRWWLESYSGRRRSIDQVHTALQAALTEAGMSAPFPTQSLDLEIGQDTTERLSKALRNQN